MDEARWRRLCEIFERIEPAPPAEHEAMLAELARDEPSLADELVSLLRWKPHADGLLDAARLDFLAAADAPVAPGGPLPRDLGRYRLLEVIGRGGMSVVYLGERVDGEYQQRVAVKLLPMDLGSAEAVHRFRLERQILAELDHPGIARLLDGGTMAEGLPFLVMELVEGERIDHHCRRLEFSVEARLRLFLRVCAAVQHAHRHLVVHRDLKPSNILVKPDGELKLLDFGIAKLLGQRRPELPTLALEGSRPMTPEYASPEQLSGAAITTASDIYSLGVLLFELLAGVPLRRASRRTPEAIAMVSSVQPAPRPSEAAGDRRLAARLRGDLDIICAMALRLEPERRYSSADALARDLERHLAGLPVEARGESAWYRAGKFVRRHRPRLAVATLAAGLLSGLGWNLSRQHDEARRQRESAADLARFLEEVLLTTDPRRTQGRRFDERSLLDRGVRQIADGLDDEPLVKARLFDTVGRIYLEFGAYPEAKDLYRRALELRRGEERPSPELLAASLQHLAGAHARLEEFAEAEVLLREALALCQLPSLAEHPGRVFVLSGLGSALQRQGRRLEAEPFLEQALAEARRNLDSAQHPRIFDDHGTVAALAARRLAINRLAAGRLGEAEALARQALVWYGRAHRSPHPYLARALVDLATVLAAKGADLEAESRLREALAMQRSLAGDEHPEIAIVLLELGKLLARTGRPAAARAALEEALAVTGRSFGEAHPEPGASVRRSPAPGSD